MHPGAGSVSCSELWWSLQRDRLTAVSESGSWDTPGRSTHAKTFKNLCVPQAIHSFVVDSLASDLCPDTL